MIIGFDISSIPYGTGVSNYTLNLVKSLLKQNSSDHYKLLFYSYRQPVPVEITNLISRYSKNVTLYHYRLPPSFFRIIWNNLHIIPIEFFIGNCDIFHTWDWTQPPAHRAKLITTVHDLVPIIYPETQHPTTINNFNRKIYWAIKDCSHIICVSQNTHDDLLKYYPKIDRSKVSVVLEAAEDKYSAFYKLPPLLKSKKINHIKKIYDLDKYVLAQGTREPRKNLDRLIQAFIKFKKDHHNKLILAITGKYGWGKDIDHLKHPYIKILGYIPEKDMVALHAGATVLAYPSLYEGFGLPPLKSITLGVPVITSNISSLPEVVGDGAYLVDPLDTNSIYKALIEITTNYHLRKNLISRGLKFSKKFSWDITAIATLNIYRQL